LRIPTDRGATWSYHRLFPPIQHLSAAYPACYLPLALTALGGLANYDEKSGLNHGEPYKAIDLLQAASACELGYQGANSVGFAGSLYPIYVRGEALLRVRHGSEAAAEFQKILDHRGIVFADPIGVLARLQLGRAFRIAGDAAQARAAYQDFLALWKDADPEIPIFQQAKAEYAKLR
jgi:eukaryotic-like serine/threonine-protein kinase